jgi:signal transduction histidine kinase
MTRRRSGRWCARCSARCRRRSSSKSGKLRLNINAVSITDVAGAAVDVIAPAAAAKQIAVEVRYDDELPPVSGDADRLQQVIWNLLSNAVKFTGPGGTVSLKITRDDSKVRLSVRDNGQGISPPVDANALAAAIAQLIGRPASRNQA